jgi:signal peptidase I
MDNNFKPSPALESTEDYAVPKPIQSKESSSARSLNNRNSPPVSKRPSGEKSGWYDVVSTIAILGTAFLVAIFMINYIFRSYQVDGPSMETTLQNSDKLIIWKVPRTIARITGNPYIPNRGDIIIFEESGLSAFGQDDKKQLIKRVTGLPGDHVVVKNSVLTIFNSQHPRGFQPDKTLAYGKVIPETSGNIDVTLKPGQLFVNGDNRPDSLDSRAFGPINASQVIGKLAIRIFPINKAEVF